MIILSILIAIALASASPLTKGQVHSLVLPTEQTVKSCSQQAGVYGTLKVTFKVNADGSVSNFTALAPHKDDAAAKCAADAINGLKFPESSKGRQSKYRFQLGGPKGAVAQVFKDNASSFSSCTGKGSVNASFTVGADGTPSDVKVTGKSAKDAAVSTCVSDAVGKLKFPPQAKPTKYTQSVKLAG